MPTTFTAENLYQSLKEYPEFLRASDLLKMGLYRGRADVTIAKRKGDSPPYIKLSTHKIVFPKRGLVDWLMKKYSHNHELDKEEKIDDLSSEIQKWKVANLLDN